MRVIWRHLGKKTEMTSLKTVMNQLSPERRERVEKRAAEIIAEELTLRDLRKARALTQARMAEVLNIGQDSVSRIEKRTDLLLSTLRGYVAAMGGTLDLVVSFPDRPPVSLRGIDTVSDGKQPGETTKS
jgi:DNA-binding XRE family transcriptional regulator